MSGKRVHPITVKLDAETLRRLDRLVTMAQLAYPGHHVNRGTLIRSLIDEKSRRVSHKTFRDTAA